MVLGGGGATEYGSEVQCHLRDAMGRVVKEGARAFPQGNMTQQQKYLGCMSDLLCEGEQVVGKLHRDMMSLARLLGRAATEAAGDGS